VMPSFFVSFRILRALRVLRELRVRLEVRCDDTEKSSQEDKTLGRNGALTASKDLDRIWSRWIRLSGWL